MSLMTLNQCFKRNKQATLCFAILSTYCSLMTFSTSATATPPIPIGWADHDGNVIPALSPQTDLNYIYTKPIPHYDTFEQSSVDTRALPTNQTSYTFNQSQHNAIDEENGELRGNANVPEAPIEFLSRNDLYVTAKSAVVMDATTGEILYGKAVDAVRPIASITKVMTAMVTLDAKLDMNEVITLVPSDFVGPIRASSKLQAGEQLNRAELLLIALMKSENPAAAALARTYPKGWNAFMDAMNRKAKKIGMDTAFFGDPTGLDVRNVSSARDLSLMVKTASKYETIKKFSSTQGYNFNLGEHILSAKNTNAIVRQGFWDVLLSKTGYINKAGRCVVMQARVNQRPVIIILLAASTSENRTLDAKKILSWLHQYVK